MREPYSVVQFLAERLHLPPLLGLPLHPEDDEVEIQLQYYVKMMIKTEKFENDCLNRRVSGAPLVCARSGRKREDTRLQGPAGRIHTGAIFQII